MTSLRTYDVRNDAEHCVMKTYVWHSAWPTIPVVITTGESWCLFICVCSPGVYPSGVIPLQVGDRRDDFVLSALIRSIFRSVNIKIKKIYSRTQL